MNLAMNRRHLLAGGAAALGASALGRIPAARAAGNEITVTCLGGIWEKALRTSFVEPFEKQSGAKVNVLLGTGPQWLSQLQANPTRPPIDVMVTVPDLALSAIEAGLVEEFSVERVPRLAEIPQFFTDALNGYGTVLDYGVAGITYNKERIKQPPRSFAEFIDRTAKGEWTASVPGIAYDVTPNMLIWPIATALGGGVDNVDPFFAAMKRMKPNLVFWSGSNQFVNHLTSGEADIGIFFDGTTWAQYDAGLTWMDFLNPQEGGSMNAITVQKIKNTSDLGWKYVDLLLTAPNQLQFSKMLNYGITNETVTYPPELAKRITPWKDAKLPPYGAIVKKRAAWVDRWNRELGA